MSGFDKNRVQQYQGQLESIFQSATNGTLTPAQANQARTVIQNYYSYLDSVDVAYGAAGLDVSQNNGFFGRYANELLEEQLRIRFPNESNAQINLRRDDIMVELAYRDMALRASNADTVGFVPYQFIAQYHYNVYTQNQLPKYAWGGALFEEFGGSGSYMNWGMYDTSVPFNAGAISSALYYDTTSEEGFTAQQAADALARALDDVGAAYGYQQLAPSLMMLQMIRGSVSYAPSTDTGPSVDAPGANVGPGSTVDDLGLWQGTERNDRLWGESGLSQTQTPNDTYYAAGGHDEIYDEKGDNYLDLGQGNDKAQLFNGDNIVAAGPGNDRIDIGRGGNSVVNLGTGDDVVDYFYANNPAYTHIAMAESGNNRFNLRAGTYMVQTGRDNDVVTGGGNTFEESGYTYLVQDSGGNDSYGLESASTMMVTDASGTNNYHLNGNVFFGNVRDWGIDAAYRFVIAGDENTASRIRIAGNGLTDIASIIGELDTAYNPTTGELRIVPSAATAALAATTASGEETGLIIRGFKNGMFGITGIAGAPSLQPEHTLFLPLVIGEQRRAAAANSAPQLAQTEVQAPVWQAIEHVVAELRPHLAGLGQATSHWVPDVRGMARQVADEDTLQQQRAA